MKTANILKWCLIIFQIISICFCIFAICFSHKWIEKQKRMVADMADSVEKFRNVYASADSDRKTILVDKTTTFIISENNSIAGANTSAFLEIQDALQAVMSFNVLALICIIYLKIKRKNRANITATNKPPDEFHSNKK